MSLPDDADVVAWVSRQIEALDDTPRVKTWRYRAMGMTRNAALAEAPNDYRLSLSVPVGEMRVLNDIARLRGVGVNTLTRRVVGTWMLACAGVEPREIPYFARGGPIR